MYLIAGSNLFGQWFGNNNIIDNFRPLFEDNTCDLDGKSAKLACICWSYNIIQDNNKLVIIGAWNGIENQCKQITIPNEIENLDLVIAGNDYNLIMANKQNGTIFILNLESEEFKRIRLNIELPIEHEPKKLKKDEGVIKTAVNNDNVLYLGADGKVYSGLLPSYVDTSHCEGNVIDIKCGYDHCLLLTDEGAVYSWGNGWRLQLGHGDVNKIETPTLVEALSGIKIVKISAGGWHSLALSEFGDVFAWGWNDTGQLGISEKETEIISCSIPKLVDFFDDEGNEVALNVTDIACGSKHSVVLLEDGSVWVTGSNKYSQLGFKSEDYPIINSFKQKITHFVPVSILCGQWSSVLYIN